MSSELEHEIEELKRQLSEFSKYSDNLLTRLVQVLARDNSIDDFNPTERDMLDSISKNNEKDVKRLCKEYMARSDTLREYRKRWGKRTDKIVSNENDTVHSLIFNMFKNELKESDDSFLYFTKFMDDIYITATKFS
jgi:hypothetical protein